MKTSLTSHGLRTVYETVNRASSQDNKVTKLSYLFSENARLIISPTNKCNNGCLHCVADSKPNGKTMSYEKFISINHEFFSAFKAADFGRRGNPLLYKSGNHDLADLVGFLYNQGLRNFTLALAIQDHRLPVIDKLEELTSKPNLTIDTMITYHHYLASQDASKLAQDFNTSLKYFIGFSNKIIISLLGHKYSGDKPAKAEEVMRAFDNNNSLIFSGIKLEKNNDSSYTAEYNQRKAIIRIPDIDTRVYPLGRFREYLDNRGILSQYEKEFNESLTDYVCPDLVKWPGIILEPDGSLNLCASFEAITCDKAIVTNIFSKTFEQVKEELLNFHKKETDWFIKNIDGIIQGKVSTCKLKNNCYET
jgi:hypothetical protein